MDRLRFPVTSSDGAWFVYMILTLAAACSTSWHASKGRPPRGRTEEGHRERTAGRRLYREPPVVEKCCFQNEVVHHFAK